MGSNQFLEITILQILPIIIALLSLIFSIISFCRTNEQLVSRTEYKKALDLTYGLFSNAVDNIKSSNKITIEHCLKLQKVICQLNDSLKICKLNREKKYNNIHQLLIELEDKVILMEKNGKERYLSDFNRIVKKIIKLIHNLYLNR